MLNHPEPRTVDALKFGQNLLGVVAAAVVDYNHIELLEARFKHLEGSRDQGRQRRRVVVCRKENSNGVWMTGSRYHLVIRYTSSISDAGAPGRHTATGPGARLLFGLLNRRAGCVDGF